MRELQPDVVLFQEEVFTAGYDQTADLVPSDWRIIHSAGRSEQEGSGISIASRWPIGDVEEVDLTAGGPPVDEFSWASLVVTVSTPSGPLLVVNHFPDAAANRENERERQAVLVERIITSRVDGNRIPVIVAGDFDAEPDAGSLRFFTGRQTLQGRSTAYVRAWDAAHPGRPCWTIDPDRNPLTESMARWPYREIDHILVRCGDDGLASLHVEGCERVHDEPRDGVWASDHYGLLADLLDPRPV